MIKPSPSAKLYNLSDDYLIAKLEGPDAANFLQGQCTNDVNALASGQMQKSAYCNHKGRVISSFSLSRESEELFFLRLHRSIAQETIEKLNKPLTFSKAELSMTTLNAFVIVGDADLDSLHSALGASIFQLNEKHREIYLDTDNTEALEGIINPEYRYSAKHWAQYLIHSGEYELTHESSEKFLPQELNFDCLDIVNFKKGCYTGQEVIARLHYRGQAKKRLRRARVVGINEAIPAHTQIIDTVTDKASGTVLLSTIINQESCEFIAVMSNTALQSECVLDTSNTTKIEWLELPYAIP